MKDFAISVLSGPLAMALLCAIGMPCGYYLGFVAGAVIVGILAIAVGIALAKITSTTTAMLAAVTAALAGAIGAYGLHVASNLETGAFVRDVPLADVAKLEGTDRFTLRDAVTREDMLEVTVHKGVSGSGSTRSVLITSCDAYPIVSADWTPAAAVSVWRFGEGDSIQGKPIGERVFRVGKPDELCERAIAKVVAKHHLTVAPQPVDLEALVSDSPSASENRYKGPFSVAFLGGLWIVVALFTSAREALATRRARSSSAERRRITR